MSAFPIITISVVLTCWLVTGKSPASLLWERVTGRRLSIRDFGAELKAKVEEEEQA